MLAIVTNRHDLVINRIKMNTCHMISCDDDIRKHCISYTVIVSHVNLSLNHVSARA